MRILVMNYEFPPVGGGGGQASADICAELTKKGHSVHVITTRVPGLPRKSAQDGYVITRIATGRRSSYRASLLDMAGYIIWGFLPTLRLVGKWRPDVIHAHFAVPTGTLAWMISFLTQVPYVLTVHLGDVPGGVPEKTESWFRWISPLTPPTWRRASRVVAVSEHTRSLARESYDVPVEVIPNGVQLSGRRRPTPVGEPPRLIFAGRFQPQKNLVFLVEALGSIKDLDWSCQLVGDGPLRGAVEKKLEELGLCSRVELTGWVTPESVKIRFAGSDLLVMPSLWEGLPVVGVQALAAGLALVANRAGGLGELVEDRKNGRLCDTGDRSCFVDALRYCLEDRNRLYSMKQVSLELAERYDVERVAQSYESLFASIVNPT